MTTTIVALKEHYHTVAKIPMREMFHADPQRFERFSLEAAGILLDYSKNRITQETLHLLHQLAAEKQLPLQIERLLTGYPVNFTEQRAALHTALRNSTSNPVFVNGFVDGDDIMPAITAMLDKMQHLTEKVRQGEWRGFKGDVITDIVNIGIGGSHLGPAMVTEALAPYANQQLRCHFVANIDGGHVTHILQSLNPATTLFILSSKSFETLEPLTNGRTIWQWFLEKTGQPQAVQHHFFAVTAKREKAIEFGILPDHIFELWEWVGGRYSLWSAIGLPIAFAIGMNNFRELLAGAEAMDQHFRHAPLAENMPVTLALLSMWYVNFFAANTQAIIPYLHSLRQLPTYLQQADMESNGKRIRRDGTPVEHATGPVIWGGEGCNAQHAFHQLLHQGTHLIPVDFILPAQSHYSMPTHHAILFAQCLGQSQALMYGKTLAEVIAEFKEQGVSAADIQRLAPHKVLIGNNPSNTLIFPKLTPRILGALLALYEHKIFVQGVMWDINSYDQWGIELGKQLMSRILPSLQHRSPLPHHDASTDGLIDYYHYHDNE